MHRYSVGESAVSAAFAATAAILLGRTLQQSDGHYDPAALPWLFAASHTRIEASSQSDSGQCFGSSAGSDMEHGLSDRP